MRDKLFATLQRVGRAFMLPIAVLPVAGLFLGISGSFTDETMLTNYGLMGVLGPGTVVNDVLQVMKAAGGIIFTNLPLIFAIAVALAMARQNKAVAALSGAIAFLVMHASIGAVLTFRFPPPVRAACESAYAHGADTTGCLPPGSFANTVGIASLQMGVFGGIIVGLGVAALHNTYQNISFPQVISFFGGERFVPIISSLVFFVVGIVMAYVWPYAQVGINALGALVTASGYAGTFAYGLIERALMPFGLHHVFYLPFWQTSVGGTLQVCGHTVEGAQNIFFAQLACPSVTHFDVDATRFMSGKFPFMIFGLPGAALAMYHTALPQKRHVAGALLLSAALTSMVTGVTEPIEFTFLFVAPVLYIIHAVLAGLAFMVMDMLGVGVGMTFSGGLIDLTLFGIMQGNDKTSWVWIPIVGVVYFVVYYVLFRILISVRDLRTPGRVDDATEVRLFGRADLDRKLGRDTSGGPDPTQEAVAAPGETRTAGAGATGADRAGSGGAGAPAVAAPAVAPPAGARDTALAETIVRGLGGADNISDIDNCITRLRTEVKDAALVDQDVLRTTGASGVMASGRGVQIVYGPQVTTVANAVRTYLHQPPPSAADHTDEVPAGAAAAHPGAADGDTPSGTPAATVTPPVSSPAMDEPEPPRAVTVVRSPFDGEAIDLSLVEDPAFAQAMVGPGIAVRPSTTTAMSPVDGEVVLLFRTKHAVGIRADTGVEVLIHIGIDTVQLKGEGFEAHVTKGDRVEVGTPLITFDPEIIEGAGYQLATPIVVTNHKKFPAPIIVASPQVVAGSGLFIVP